MKQRSQSERVQPAHWNPFVIELIHNRYRQPDKAPAASCCPIYGTVYLRGHWLWRSPPSGTTSLVCSVCRRAADQMPAVRIHLSGGFEAAHQEGVLTLTCHHEVGLRADHPMEHIMAVESTSSGTSILTAGFHLTRDIGHAIHHTFHGHLAFDYSNAETELHVKWSR